MIDNFTRYRYLDTGYNCTCSLGLVSTIVFAVVSDKHLRTGQYHIYSSATSATATRALVKDTSRPRRHEKKHCRAHIASAVSIQNTFAPMARTRLTPENVVAIFNERPHRSRCDQPFTPCTHFTRQLADDYNICERTIRDIWNRRSWRENPPTLAENVTLISLNCLTSCFANSRRHHTPILVAPGAVRRHDKWHSP